MPTAGKYAAALVTRIANWLATYEAAQLLATCGDRQTLIAARNTPRDLLLRADSRTR